MKNPKDPVNGPKKHSQDDNPNHDKKLSIPEVIASMDPPFRDAYDDPTEIQNYSQDGSVFYRKSRSQIRDMVKENAIEHGLDEALLDDFKNGSKLWKNDAEYRIVGDYKVFFKDQKPFSTGQGILPDGSLAYTLSFPTEREYERNKEIFTRREYSNFIITNKRIFFPCTESEFRKKDLYANMPEEPIQSRWSMNSREDFLGRITHVDPWDVFKRIKEGFDKYIDFGEVKGGSTLCSVYSILTYVFVLFDAVPYLKIEGITNSGKTKLGEVFFNICFNATMGVDQTPSVIYRTIEAERSTMIVDEIEGLDKNRQTDRMLELFPIFNSGYKSTGSVMRTEGNSLNRKRVNYSTYSPKIFCAIDPLLETIKNRSYVIMLIRTLDEKRSNLSISSKDPAWQEIRDDLYVLAMEYFEEIKEIADSMEITNDLKLIGRDYEKAKPILAIARFIAKHSSGDNSILQEIREFLEQQKNEDGEHAIDSIEAAVILEIEAIINEERQTKLDPSKSDYDIVQIKIPDLSLRVATALGYNIEKLNKVSFSKKIANIVKRLGLMKNRKTVGQRATAFECNSALIKEAKQRYKMETTLSDPSHPSHSPHLPLSSHLPHLPHLSPMSEFYLTYPENIDNSGSPEDKVRSVRSVRSKCTETKEEKKGDLTLIDEEVALIAYQEKKIALVRIKENWHSFDSPSIDKLRNSAVKLATMDYPLLRVQNDVIEWIGDRWSE